MRHLWHLQQLGHEVHIIIGSFTGQIGDSSDKDSERPMLSAAEIERNMSNYEGQLAKIFDTSKMRVHYNHTWFDKMPLKEFFELQQIFTVAQMIERDNFNRRFRQNKRIGLHEFSYALLQGYDSVAVKADIEIGGTDQLFNLLAGRTIQKHYGQKPQEIITYELLMGTDGRKMSTTWGNCIYVDDDPDEMFGKTMSIRDELIYDYFRIATEVSSEELAEIKRQFAAKKFRELKERLACELVSIYHGQAAAAAARDRFNRTFKEKQVPRDIPQFKIESLPLALDSLLLESKLVKSKSEARRLLQQGAIKLDGHVVSGNEIEASSGQVLQVGKRRFLRLV